MAGKIFAKVIAEVVETNSKRELNEEEQASFHGDLEKRLSSQVERLRAEKRKAYENIKNIAVV